MSTANLPAKRTPPQGGNLAEILKAASGRIAEACPEHFTPARLMQLASVLVYKTPKLQQCHPESIITAMIQVGSLGLDLNPSMMEAFLIPRWNKDAGVMEAQFQPGYQGLAKLAVNTGSVNKIVPREVCENDTFEVWQVDGVDHVKHGVNYKLPRGRETHYYAVATTTTGPVVEVMTFEQTEEIRSRSQYPDGGPWRDWPGEMRKKSVVKRLCKRLPRSADPHAVAAFERLQTAIDIDDREYQNSLEAPAKPDNQSGFGQGMYASPEDSAVFEVKLKGFLAEINDKWLNSLSEVCRGDIPKSVRELNEYQADGHLLKWAVETGRLDRAIVPEDAKIRQRYRYTAVVYHRSKADQGALGRELRAYAETHWLRQIEALGRDRPELLPALVERYGIDGPMPVVAEDDPDPEFDEPGSDG